VLWGTRGQDKWRAPVFSLLSSQGALAAVYAMRAIVCAGLPLLLMIRADRPERAGKVRSAKEAREQR